MYFLITISGVVNEDTGNVGTVHSIASELADRLKASNHKVEVARVSTSGEQPTFSLIDVGNSGLNVTASADMFAIEETKDVYAFQREPVLLAPAEDA